MFDPHGEYDTLAEMQGNKAFRGEDGYEPVVVYYDPDRLRVRISELEIGDVMAILDNPSNRMQERRSTAWRAMQRRESRTWGSMTSSERCTGYTTRRMRVSER